MAHSSNVQKVKKKKSHRARELLILAFIVAIILIAAKSAFQSTSSTTQSSTVSLSSSLAVSTTSTPVVASEFQVVQQTGFCGYDTNNLKFAQIQGVLQNNQSLFFHFLSAKIIFVNYTLANGTVISVNETHYDNTQTNATSHSLSFLVDSKIPKTGPKIATADFVVIANVEGVSEPIVRLVSLTVDC
jgi:hypothetical protein